MRKEPRQRVPELRQRERHGRIDPIWGEEPEQRQGQDSADQGAPGLARDARRERAPHGRDDVKGLRGELDERCCHLDVDGGPLRRICGEAAEEEGRDEEGRDEAAGGEGERGRRGELERAGVGFLLFFFAAFVVVIFGLLRRRRRFLPLLPSDAPSTDPLAGQEEDGCVDEVELDGGDLKRRRKEEEKEGVS